LVWPISFFWLYERLYRGLHPFLRYTSLHFALGHIFTPLGSPAIPSFRFVRKSASALAFRFVFVALAHNSHGD
jgi:hypothetical protein